MKKSLLEKLRAKQFYKRKKMPSFSADVILYLLHLRYTPLQACHLLPNKFPSPPISFLNKIQEGHVDAMKALKVLKMEEKVQRPKATFICNRLHSIRVRIFVRSNEEWQPYKGIVVSMTFGLKYPFSL